MIVIQYSIDGVVQTTILCEGWEVFSMVDYIHLDASLDLTEPSNKTNLGGIHGSVIFQLNRLYLCLTSDYYTGNIIPIWYDQGDKLLIFLHLTISTRFCYTHT